MKFTSTIILLSLSFNVFSNDCMIKDSSLIGKVQVLPQYEATVNYFFDKKVKEAFATVAWKLDEERTRSCFKDAESLYPNREIVVPRSHVTSLTVQVKGGLKNSILDVFPQANGHFFGNSVSIPVSYQSKGEITDSISRKEDMVKINGDLSYVMTKESLRVLGEMDCSKDHERSGILILIDRMKDLQQNVKKLASKGRIDTEKVHSEFLGHCVEFKNVEADTFEDFERQQKISSQLKDQTFQIVGTVSVSSKEPLPAVATQKISVLDI